MFDQEQSDAFVLAPEGMNERCVPVLVLRPLLEWYEKLYHFGVSSGGGPHERGDAIPVRRVPVRNDDLGGLYVSTPESPVERHDSDCRSSPSHVQGGPLQLPCNLSAQRTQASPATGVSPRARRGASWPRPRPTGNRAHEGCLVIRRGTLRGRLGAGVDVAAPGRSV